MTIKINLPEQLKLHLIDLDIESQYLKPSYYTLEIYSNKLLDLIRIWKTEDITVNDNVFSLERKIEIYIVDLPGHLKDDQKKGNKRYREKWIILKENIEEMKNELLSLWNKTYKS